MKLRKPAVLIGLLSAALVLTSCGHTKPTAAPAALESLREIASPAGADSAQGNLAVGPDGAIYLSWMETADDGSPMLKFATLKDEKWSPAQTIIKSEDLMVNWADFPSLLPMGGGLLAAHWLSMIPNSEEGYGIKIAFSRDNGKTWSKPVAPHRDHTKTEHGLVSLLPAPGGGVGVLWLDSRKLAGPKKSDDVALLYTTIGLDGKLGPETTVDGRVCECCQPSAQQTTSGTLAVYRGRTTDEVRDITTVHFDGAKWSEPKVVFADGWKINACPINGPAMAVEGNRVAVAWFTGANEQAKVEIAFSNDGGETFRPPQQVDDGKPMGRVNVVLQDSGSALVTWLERSDKGAQLRARRMEENGPRQPSLVVGTTDSGESAGFPRTVRSGNNVLFAWTDAKASRVRVAVLYPKS